MTDNQIKQMMTMMTKCVNGLQRVEENMKTVKSDMAELKSDMAQLKSDVAQLKVGQNRIEREMFRINSAFDTLAGESIRVKNRVEILERDFSN